MSSSQKLPPDLKLRWLAALRSGEYAQARTLLHTPRGFCCLGVLCDITKTETGGNWTVLFENNPNKYFFTNGLPINNPKFDGSDSVLPAFVHKELKLDELTITLPENHPIFDDWRLRDHDSNHLTLVTLNDSDFTFTEIADLIEKYL